MIKNLLAVTALAVAVSVPVVAFAGGDLEPTPQIVTRPAAPKATPVEVVKAETAAVVEAVTNDTRNHGLFLGVISSTQLSNWEFDELTADTGYLTYSPVTTGFSPVAGVIFGEAKGFILGAGYGINNTVKPYVTLASLGDDYIDGKINIGAQAGVQVALPVGLALDLGVLTPEVSEIGKSGSLALPYVGVGYRF